MWFARYMSSMRVSRMSERIRRQEVYRDWWNWVMTSRSCGSSSRNCLKELEDVHV